MHRGRGKKEGKEKEARSKRKRVLAHKKRTGGRSKTLSVSRFMRRKEGRAWTKKMKKVKENCNPKSTAQAKNSVCETFRIAREAKSRDC